MSLTTPAQTRKQEPGSLQASASLSDLYQEVIMEHSRRPRFKGKPTEGCQFCQEGKNPLCGDQITLYCKVDSVPGLQPTLSLSFDGHGCSISQASASILCEAVQGLPVQTARSVLRRAESIYTGKAAPAEDEDLEEDVDALYGVSKFPVRVKCAALPWKTFDLILEDKFDAKGNLKSPDGACSTLTGCARERRTLRVVSTED